MKAKSIITPLLLLFVGASVVYVVVGESASRRSAAPGGTPVAGDAAPVGEQGIANAVTTTGLPSGTAQPPVDTSQSEVNSSGTAEASRLAPPAAGKTIAYYFHSTQRCPTCLAIERQAHEALTEAFSAELACGALEWHALNTDEPAHEHFVKDFQLVASSLVLVRQRDGGVASWSNLDKVWDLVHDEPEFRRYVAEQTRAFLEK